MSRHHPYGGYDGPPRRGGAPHGPGPERTFRFERGGGRGGRGRGGGPPSRGGYNNFGAHNPPAPAPAYDGYSNGAPPYSGGGGGGDPFYNDYPPPAADNYDGYEDGPGRGPPQPRRRREREDQVHDSLIEQRIQRERPCRTLFIRNIKYETDSNHVRARFEEFGQIKSFYDLISSRGMVFVTYFDLRAAEQTRERLQGTELAGRPIDVHYSLPRADEQNGRCDRDKNQGTLLVSLRESRSGEPIDEHELRRKFQQFGDVKGIKPAGSPTDRYVEMYDTRSCEAAHDKLRRQSLQDGVMEIEFAWDIPDQPLPPGPIPRRHESPPRDDFRGRGGRGGRGGPGRGRGRGGGFGGDRDYRDDMDARARDNWDRERRDMDVYNRDREPPPRPHHGGYNSGPAPPMPPQNYPMYPGSAPPPPPPQDDRLEQAKKVQQLLEALKGPGAAAATPAPPTPAQAPAPVAPRQHMPPPPQTAGNPYYPPPPQAASYAPAPTYSQPPVQPAQYPGYSAPPPIPAPPPAPVQAPPPPVQSAAPTLPPNIMALLQAQQAPTPPPAQVPQYGVPPPAMNHTGYPPPTPAAMAPPAPANTASQVQQLMALLQKRA